MDAILTHKKSVNLKEMINPTIQVVLFGEASHNPRDYKKELANSLPALKALGFTHLGLEMIPTNLNNNTDIIAL